jgi:hypothetical protein
VPFFKNLSMFNSSIEAGAVGASSASRYGSIKMIWLLAAPVPQHWGEQLFSGLLYSANSAFLTHFDI